MKYLQFDQSKEFDIILLGRVAVDFNPLDYYRPLSESNTFKKYLGGSPANIAVGLARLGKKVGFLSKVSDDAFGDFVTGYFQREGIDISHITKCKNGEKTGLTFTEMRSETESSILMYREGVADLQLSVEDVEEAYICRSKSILISGTALSMSPSREAALKALALAKKNHLVVIFDIDYRPYSWKNTEELSVYYSYVAGQSDLILGSREEFDLTEALTAPGRTDEQTAAYFHAQGSSIVVIKHGKEGSTAYTNDGNHFSIKPFPVKVLKSFGGGDGYASAFLYGLLEDRDIMECLELGSASAAMLVSSHGCSEDMPDVESLCTFISDTRMRYGEMIVKEEER